MSNCTTVATLKKYGYTKTTISDYAIKELRQTTLKNGTINDIKLKDRRIKKTCEICGNKWTGMNPDNSVYDIVTNSGMTMVCKECAERIIKVVADVVYIPLKKG